MSDERAKQSFYFPRDMLNEIQQQAVRLDRSVSWVVAHAWKLARGKIRKTSASDTDEDLPGANGSPSSNEGI